MQKTIVFSLGGSLIVPDAIDVKFLAGFRRVVLEYIKQGNRAIIICGGGQTSRAYQQAARALNPRLSPEALDAIGIEATKFNAWLVRDIFGRAAESRILYNPTEKIRTKKRIIIGCGWKPGCSSDKDAVLAARTFGVRTIINLSNIAYVYDKDPRKFKSAKAFPRLTWKEFLKIVGSAWKPGAHLPFDPVAARLARRLGLTLVVMSGSDLKNVQRYARGKPFRGTVVEGV